MIKPRIPFTVMAKGPYLAVYNERGVEISGHACATAIEAGQRAAVVQSSLAWIGTPYHHRTRIRGVGTDCAMFVLEIFESLGLIPHEPVPSYRPDWSLHRSEGICETIIRRHARDVVVDEAKPGDVVLWKFGRSYSHAAIIMPPRWPAIIHAFNEAGQVIPDRGDGGYVQDRPRLFFSYWREATTCC